MYTGWRPIVSERGPPMTGPTARAKTKRVKGRIAVVRPMWNSLTKSAFAGEEMDVPIVLRCHLLDEIRGRLQEGGVTRGDQSNRACWSGGLSCQRTSSMDCLDS